MTRSALSVCVLGAGSWGTALAHHLCLAGHSVSLWGRDSTVLSAITSAHENPRYFPTEKLAPGIMPVSDPSEALAKAQAVVFAVPSSAVREVSRGLAQVIPKAALVVSTAKGLEQGTFKTMTTVLSEELGNEKRVTVLAGPSFALEVVRGLPAAVTAAGTDSISTKEVASLFHYKNLRVYTSPDLIGVELGGIIKNVIALACGVVDGMQMGSNARAALITRGLAEMQRLIIALGGEAQTVIGLSGLGDLLLTATGELSRNRRVGLRLGQGEKLDEILASIGQVAEAVVCARQLSLLAEKQGVSVPIIEQVDKILSGNTTIPLALESLLNREQRSES